MARRKFRVGDVISYSPEQHHCREGFAIARDCNGVIRLFDTYWGSYNPSVVIKPQNVKRLFNLEDVESVHSREAWERYKSSDRFYTTEQHGCRVHFYVRKGAVEDLATQIENARRDVEAAESDVRVAEYSLEWRRKVLTELEQKAAQS